MIILAYHRVNPAPRGDLSITIDAFRQQLLYLLHKGYRNVSLTDAVDDSQRLRFPRRSFAITFDDGYRDNYLHAMPILAELELRATVFVTVNYIDMEQPYAWDHRRILLWGGDVREEDLSLTWAQLEEMERSGLFTIGSHTLSHPNLTTIDAAAARHEITTSRHILEERLGHPVTLFSYPRGDLNRAIISLVRDAGYTSAVVTPPRPVPHTDYTLPRIGIYQGTNSLRVKLKTSPLYQTLLWSGILPYGQIVRGKFAQGRS